METKPQITITKARKPKKCAQWWTNKNRPIHYRYVKETYFNDETIDQLCRDGVQWAEENNRAVKLGQFFRLKGINKRQWEHLCATNQVVKDAHEAMLEALGDRRELNMLEGKYKEHSNMYVMHNYDEDWDKANKYHDQRKREQNAEIFSIRDVIMEVARNVDAKRGDTPTDTKT